MRSESTRARTHTHLQREGGRKQEKREKESERQRKRDREETSDLLGLLASKTLLLRHVCYGFKIVLGLLVRQVCLSVAGARWSAGLNLGKDKERQ